MTPDEVIELRKRWARYNFGPILPEATVLADPDWLAYVQAMASTVPQGESLAYPTEQDARWAWPEGVCIVFDQPFGLDHTIVSYDQPGLWGTQPLGRKRVPAHAESQRAQGLAILGLQAIAAELQDGTPVKNEVVAHPIMWIAEDPSDIISTHWLPGHHMMASDLGVMSESSRLLLSIVTALGHRLTRIGDPVGTRAERRRIGRELPEGLRVLKLATGASVSRSEASGTVEWQRRWMVRGHWRLQPYGPERKLRRTQWIDPYVKGPEDKPLDVRPTIWKTGHPAS